MYRSEGEQGAGVPQGWVSGAGEQEGQGSFFTHNLNQEISVTPVDAATLFHVSTTPIQFPPAPFPSLYSLKTLYNPSLLTPLASLSTDAIPLLRRVCQSA